MFWMSCYKDNCATHLSDKKDSEWYLKSSWRNQFYAAVYYESEVHDENNNEDSYIMIENVKVFNNEKSDMKKFISIEEMML